MPEVIHSGPGRSGLVWRPLVWIALAAILYLTIADAAVESFIRGSPLRWYIAGAAILYLAACAALWRLQPGLWARWSWASRAATSFLLLLALLTATAWLPGGLEQGLRLFGQSTSTVLAVLSGVVVAICGTLIARLSFVPLAGKIIVGLLTAYGVAAFLLAVVFATPFASLFHGGSVWTRLPFWLQGAVVGALLIVPVALALELTAGLRRITRVQAPEFAARIIALAMGLAISVAAVRLHVDVTSASADTPAASANETSNDSSAPPPKSSAEAPADEAGYQQTSEKLDKLYAGLDVLNGKMDRSLFEIDALAARLGSDPVAAFHFVRDEIRYEPYVGVLRGALGTLLCRAGNSLDRSLLLAALLQRAGLETQIARGQLTAQQSQLLVSRLFEPVKPVPRSVPALVDLAPDLAAAIGADKAALLRLVADLQKPGDQRKREFLDNVEKQAGYLSTLLGKAGVEVGGIASKEQLLEEARDHYWVQYQDAGGNWVDLDASFADAEPGKIVATAAETFATNSVPEGLYHNLQITLTLRVAEVTDGKDGEARDETLIDQELRIADQQGRDITIATVPIPAPSVAPGSSIVDALAAAKGYQTVLQVGNDVTLGKYFDLDGQVSDQQGGAAHSAGGIGRSVGGMGGGLGGALGGDTSAATETRIVGLRADYTLSSPLPQRGTPASRIYHRDIVPAGQVTAWSANSPNSPRQIAARLSKDQLRQRLLWRAQLLPVVGAIAVDYQGYLSIKSLLENRSWVDALARTSFGLSPIAGLANPSNPVPIRTLQLAEGATQLADEAAQMPAARRYFCKPGLLTYESGVAGAADQAHVKRGYDIVAFAPRIAVNDASPSSQIRHDVLVMKLRSGVITTDLESALMSPTKVLTGDSSSGTRSLGAAQVLAAATSTGVPLVLLRPGDADLKTLAALSVPDPVKAELWATLAAGDNVIVPAKTVVFGDREQVAWWRLDPASGELIGVMPGGRGQGSLEFAENVWTAVSFVYCIGDAERGTRGAMIFMGCVATAVAFHAGGDWPMSSLAANSPELWALGDIISVYLFHFGDDLADWIYKKATAE